MHNGTLRICVNRLPDIAVAFRLYGKESLWMFVSSTVSLVWQQNSLWRGGCRNLETTYIDWVLQLIPERFRARNDLKPLLVVNGLTGQSNKAIASNNSTFWKVRMFLRSFRVVRVTCYQYRCDDLTWLGARWASWQATCTRKFVVRGREAFCIYKYK